jgi:hypothetical protein
MRTIVEVSFVEVKGLRDFEPDPNIPLIFHQVVEMDFIPKGTPVAICEGVEGRVWYNWMSVDKRDWFNGKPIAGIGLKIDIEDVDQLVAEAGVSRDSPWEGLKFQMKTSGWVYGANSVVNLT